MMDLSYLQAGLWLKSIGFSYLLTYLLLQYQYSSFAFVAIIAYDHITSAELLLKISTFNSSVK